MRIELETQASAIERFRAKHSKRRKPLIASGLLMQGQKTVATAIERISRERTLVVFEATALEIIVPLPSKKETIVLDIN